MKLIKKILLICLLEIILSPFILASETDTSHGGTAWLEFAGKLINFLILFGALTYFLYRPLRTWLQSRTQSIAKNLEEVSSARKKAEQELALISERLAMIQEELNQITQAAEKDGLREKERIFSLAQEEAARIQRLAALEVEALKKGAIRELKAHAAGLATALAEARIREKLTPEIHRHLIRRSIERLGKLHESTNAG